MRFITKIIGQDDGSIQWTTEAVAADVSFYEVGRAGSIFAGRHFDSPNQHILTEGQAAAQAESLKAALVLPPGWEASLDGVNVETMVGGPTKLAKRFVRADGASIVVPVGPDGIVIPETTAALRAYDAANPLPS